MPEKSKKFEFFRVAIGVALVLLVSKIIDHALPESTFLVRAAASLALILPVGIALDAALVFGWRNWRRK